MLSISIITNNEKIVTNGQIEYQAAPKGFSGGAGIELFDTRGLFGKLMPPHGKADKPRFS